MRPCRLGPRSGGRDVSDALSSQYREVHRKASDTFDKVDSASFRAGGAVVAMTTYAIGDQPTRIAPHIGHDAVRQILRTAKLDVELVYTLGKP